jgi:PKD repeat protein
MNHKRRMVFAKASERPCASVHIGRRRRLFWGSRGSVVLLCVGVAAALVVGVSRASEAVVEVAPTWPIPADAPPGPPPIPALPAAAPAAPPADAISDPVTAGASCGGWHLVNSYGGAWPGGSPWWEYRCAWDSYFYFTPCTGGGMCDMYCPNCYVETETRADYFYWNGADAVFYGQGYLYDFYYTQLDYPGITISAWWDGQTVRWYLVPPGTVTPAPNVAPFASFTAACSGLTCSFDPADSVDSDGHITRFDWAFGDGSSAGGSNTNPQDNVQHHTYTQAGTYIVWLTVRDDRSATHAVMKDVVVGTRPPPPPNTAPTASFTFTCAYLTCSFDGGASSDTDGAIGGYVWNLGDGTVVEGNTLRTAQHSYSQPGSYTAGLTVTDNGGATNTQWLVIAVEANAPPTARFTVACTGLSCSFDGSGSADPDGAIVNYAWAFGDGASGSGNVTSHTYGRAGNYTVTLTVTDNVESTANVSKAVAPISLSARGYKVSGQQRVDLVWSGRSAASFDMFRNGSKIATAQIDFYTDVITNKGSGIYAYKVCAAATASCSTDATVRF